MTSFANSVYFIYFTYSVVWGFGSSLSFATTTFVLGEVRCVEVDISQLINNVLNFIPLPPAAVPLPFFYPIFVQGLRISPEDSTNCVFAVFLQQKGRRLPGKDCKERK